MTKIIKTDNYNWVNEHNNVKKQVLHRYQIFNEPTNTWKEGLKGIQKMIAEAKVNEERVRSYGGKWSLSDVAICNDSIHDSKPLTFYGSVGHNSISGSAFFSDDPKPHKDRLFYFQAGAQVNQINNTLEEKGLALATTGASNGQTLAGAISTGTHGSALFIGSMQDYVRALHIVTSDSDHVILQPSSQPIINSNFSNVFNSKLINDDDLFYSALVSFGSFGIIHGIIVEAVSLYSLEAWTIRTDFDKAKAAFQLLKNFDHEKNDNLQSLLEQYNLPAEEDPYHFELVINPHSENDNCYLKAMYKCNYDATKLSPLPTGSTTRVGDDVLSVIGDLAGSMSVLTPTIVDALFGQVADIQSGFTQTPKNIFGDSVIYKPSGGAASTELGVAVKDAQKAVELAKKQASQDKFAGVMGIRFVKPSKGTLAFTRFGPLTCTIELPGLNSSVTQTFYSNLFKAMDAANIHFTLHWGQEGDYSRKRLTKMYGDNVVKWENDRKRLLPESNQRYMFTNDFMKRCGLSESPKLDGGDEIS